MRGSRIVAGFVRPANQCGTIHNRLQVAAEQAAALTSPKTYQIFVGPHDEIYQGGQPVLVGVDARSTYCYLQAAAESRDENTWDFICWRRWSKG